MTSACRKEYYREYHRIKNATDPEYRKRRTANFVAWKCAKLATDPEWRDSQRMLSRDRMRALRKPQAALRQHQIRMKEAADADAVLKRLVPRMP